MYSNPPLHGARIVSTVLDDEELTADFITECKGMADRINSMRVALRDGLAAAGSTKDWSHITTQIGMFAYSGLNKEQVDRMREEYAIYCTGDGRISMAGVTSKNVEYLAKAIHEVSK
jgi:aspartate aminotransferase